MTEESSLSKSKVVLFTALSLLLLLIFLAAAGELMVRFFNPQATLSPRFMFSQSYGQLLFPATKMIHHKPGRFRYEYTVNAEGYRGPVVTPAESRHPVIILGDSYAFGIGVTDGDEFAAILRNQLKETRDVINLGVPSWGLAQQIKWYYERGAAYKPETVILQFCHNDPEDNLKNKTTDWDGTRFVFYDNPSKINLVKKFMSQSPLQNSQVYNLLRQSVFQALDKKHSQKIAQESGGAEKPGEDFYVKLLTAFVSSLKAKGTQVILISVPDELERFPKISAAVQALKQQGLLEYYNTAEWLEGIKDYESPEGHRWGKKAHRIIADKLAKRISG